MKYDDDNRSDDDVSLIRSASNQIIDVSGEYAGRKKKMSHEQLGRSMLMCINRIFKKNTKLFSGHIKALVMTHIRASVHYLQQIIPGHIKNLNIHSEPVVSLVSPLVGSGWNFGGPRLAIFWKHSP